MRRVRSIVYCAYKLVGAGWATEGWVGSQDGRQGMHDELWWANLVRERETLNTEKENGDKYEDEFR